MSAISVSSCTAPCSWQARFLSVLPAVMTHARIQFRGQSSERREESTQEAVASACVAFQLLAARGKLHAATPATLASFAVKHVWSGRHVGSRQDTSRDVLSPAAQRRHQLNVVGFSPGASGDQWEQAALADKRMGVADLAAFRLDFGQWLGQMSQRDRRIVAALASGESSGEVAGRFGLSVGRVSQLRREYEYRWQVFQGEVPAATPVN